MLHPDRRPLDARPCAGYRPRCREPLNLRWWSDQACRTCAPRPHTLAPDVQVFEQPAQLGTAHAALAARAALDGPQRAGAGRVCGQPTDASGNRAQADRCATGPGPRLPCSPSTHPIPSGYGRLICDAQGRVTAIREHKGCHRCRASHRPVQCRGNGISDGGISTALLFPDRQQQCQGRVLSDRRCCDRDGRRPGGGACCVARPMRQWGSIHVISWPPQKLSSSTAPASGSCRRVQLWWPRKRSG